MFKMLNVSHRVMSIHRSEHDSSVSIPVDGVDFGAGPKQIDHHLTAKRQTEQDKRGARTFFRSSGAK